MRTIVEVLDRVKKVQKLKSDYKLSLTVGIGESSLHAYRNRGTLPDEINCKKLADAAGDDPALLVVEMQAQRAKSEEARAIWLSIAKRLQTGFSNVKLLAVLAMIAIASIALPAWAGIYFVSNAAVQSVYYVKSIIGVIYSRLTRNVKVCKAGFHVPRTPYPAAVRPA